MKKATDYVVVSAANLDNLQASMQEFLSRESASAWCPIGPPVFAPDGKEHWHQAVVGFSKEDDAAA